MSAHIHGEGHVEAIIAPNRYRRLFKDHPKTQAQHEAERAACVHAMRTEWPDKAGRALGLGLCTCWEPILQWERAA